MSSSPIRGGPTSVPCTMSHEHVHQAWATVQDTMTMCGPLLDSFSTCFSTPYTAVPRQPAAHSRLNHSAQDTCRAGSRLRFTARGRCKMAFSFELHMSFGGRNLRKTDTTHSARKRTTGGDLHGRTIRV